MFLPGESHGQRNLAGYSPWGHKESDTTEQLHFQDDINCLSVSCGGTGQQWPAAGAGALGAADLGLA